MREYWDARAAEDALFFVDNRIPNRGEDRERFWDGGEEAPRTRGAGRAGEGVEGGEGIAAATHAQGDEDADVCRGRGVVVVAQVDASHGHGQLRIFLRVNHKAHLPLLL